METFKHRIISQTKNGKVFKCRNHGKFLIEYKNLSYTFDEEEYNFFKNYFLTLDPEKWERINAESFYKRKIHVPIGHRNFTTVFHKQEILELKRLLGHSSGTHNFEFLGVRNLEMDLSMN